MPNGAGGLTADELCAVLEHYDIGQVQEAQPLAAGNRASPKLLLTTPQGRFVLKRRPRGKDDALQVEFTHVVQRRLRERGYPVAGLVPTRRGEGTALCWGARTYELFHYVEGQRCDGSAAEVMDAGRQLAVLHRCVRDVSWRWMPARQTYHDSSSVRGHLRVIRSEEGPGQGRQGPPDAALRQAAHDLLMHYNQAATTVNAQGFDTWPIQIVHGDWHPGNLLFADHQMICVLDFDSVRMAPCVTDLANGVLQFSIVGVRPNPAEWPPYLDQAKMSHFLEGYQQVESPGQEVVRVLPDLMIELMIAEAVLPIAATGYFGHHSGLDFLRMIHRKCDWIEQNRESLLEVIFHH